MKIKSLSGKYFSRYNENTHYVFSPTRTIGKNGIIIYSFDDSNTVLLYDELNNSYREVILECPLFRENSAFDQASTMDHNYLAKYYTENDRFNNFIFDPFHNMYYRIMGKGAQFVNSDGTINSDKEFIILVYDDAFRLLKQIAFPSKVYNQFMLFCTKDLVYLVTSTNFSDPLMHLHGFKFL
jgi:hypothetical protein